MTFPFPFLMSMGAATDPHFSNVSLLLHGNASPIVDSSKYSRVPSAVNSVTISTVVFKFGGGSLLFPDPSDMLFSGSADLNPGADDFTLEFWIRFRSLKTNQIIWSGGVGNSGFFLLWMNGNTLKVSRQGISDVLTYNWVGREANSWYHIAVSRQSDMMRIFIDGAIMASETVTQNFPNGTNIVLGSYGGSGEYRLDAYIDDLRFTKGICRYVSSFTPPTSQLPDK